MANSLLRKGAWTAEEDTLLKNCIEKFGESKWHLVPLRAGLNRCRKSCRLRWLNYLRPNIKRGDFGEDEVDLMLRLHKLLGNRWSLIAGRIPGRTANDVKNYWNTHLKSRPKQQKGQLKDSEPLKHTTEGQLKDSEPLKHTTVTVIKPQPHNISKGLNLSSHITTCDTQNMITSSSMDGIGNALNLPPDLLSSPTLSFEKINGYLDEFFDNPEKGLEIDDGWPFEGFSSERDRLDVVGLVDPPIDDSEILLGLFD